MISKRKSDPRALCYAYDEFSKEIIKRFNGDSSFTMSRFNEDAFDYSQLLHQAYIQNNGKFYLLLLFFFFKFTFLNR
jgi:hypothetical protein